ncbi:MAG: lysozyme inhibitor LprI family protein [Mariprofundaceae bacterium]|nr:lysozyme inhibitor LprI family protein [Mariprofundaceae bacterium]
MKHWRQMTMLCCVVLLSPCWAYADDAESLKSSVQQQETEDPCVTYQSLDARMNDLYQAIKTQYADDKKKIHRLRKVQKNWLRFRDSHLALLFPVSEQISGEYGSVTPMCRCYELAALTQVRNVQLSALLNPEEGDVCAVH